MSKSEQSAPKRRVKLINPSLQLRLVGAFAGITAIALLTESLLLGLLLNRMAERVPSMGNEINAEIPMLLVQSIGASMLLVLPALLVIGTRVTFKVAGPLYRMQGHLDSVARGEEVGKCSIRKGDCLQDFCDSLNDALDAATGATSSPQPAAQAAEEPESARSAA